MWRFVIAENIRRYQSLLKVERSPSKIELLTRQLAEAEAELADLVTSSTPDRVRRNQALSIFAQQGVDEAIRLCGAQFGNLQIYDKRKDGLIIIAQKNFRANFLHHFEIVKPFDGSSCGRCFVNGNQVAISDVDGDSEFEPHRVVAKEAGVRAILSSPVRNGAKSIIGILSIHYALPRTFSEDLIRRAGSYADALGEALDIHLQH